MAFLEIIAPSPHDCRVAKFNADLVRCRVELEHQRIIDRIIEGKSHGHYYLLIGEKVSSGTPFQPLPR